MKAIESAFLLFRASSVGQAGIVKLLLKEGVDGGSHPISLCQAARTGHIGVVEVLLVARGFTAAVSDHALYRAAANGHVEIVRLLVKAGANMHMQHDLPMEHAIHFNHVETVRTLLILGEHDFEHHDHGHYSLCIFCSAIRGGNTDIIKLFLRRVTDFESHGSLMFTGLTNCSEEMVEALARLDPGLFNYPDKIRIGRVLGRVIDRRRRGRRRPSSRLFKFFLEEFLKGYKGTWEEIEDQMISPGIRETAKRMTSQPELPPELVREIFKLTHPITIRNLRRSDKGYRSLITDKDLAWTEAGWRYHTYGAVDCCLWAVREGYEWIVRLYASEIATFEQTALEALLFAALEVDDVITDIVISAGGAERLCTGDLLVAAAREGYVRIIETWMKGRAKKDPIGFTPFALRVAAFNGNVQAVILLASGQGTDNLAIALKSAAGQNQVEVVQLLLGWTKYSQGQYDRALIEGVMHGAETSVKMLLEAGADVHADWEGPLAKAVTGGY
ncbi:hypothetical protein HDV00_003061 [Rhizophlyctis rosea]|nr:hypothetical protein HDV00_003061 [Rhizophlyctis rosea]